MDRRIWLLIIVWHIMMSCVCARNMLHLSPSHAQAQIFQSPRWPTEEFGSGAKEEDVVNRLAGSRPPGCEHKCGGCNPCSPTQVPTVVHFGPQYGNYEPEGWKCKCGAVFYNP